MKFSVVTIFPEFFNAIQLSLLGKAQDRDLLAVDVHNLRDWTSDIHKTVDDAPFGGGAGMVMRPDVWGAALDAVLEPGGTLIIPSPAGEVLTQDLVSDLADRQQLVFACGRYEGIDARVGDYYRTAGFEVREISLGDYVLNGGEVAALAMIEAIARLLPGFMGNAASLLEESHSDGLLEYPSYTRPATWRNMHVPEVLLSGHHARIQDWRREQQLERTRRRRPDLLSPSAE